MRRTRLITAATAMALLAPAAAMAQVDTSEWICKYCPFEDGYRADYSAGGSYVSEDAPRFGNGSGLDEKGAYADLDGQGRLLRNGTDVSWYAEDLGLSSRVVEFDVGRPGRFGINFGYRELPYRRFGDTLTPYSLNGDALELPAGWVPAATTGTMTGLSSALMPRRIELDRSVLDLGAKFRANSRIRLFADYRRQQRDGTGLMSGPFFFQAEHLPRPVDDYTDRFDAGVAYAGETFHVRLAYYGSFYRNELDSLTWDNPFTPLPGADQGRLALEPDNDFQQVALSGAWRLPAWDTVLAFSLASGRGEQNDDLLLPTINPTIPMPLVLPAPINGKVDTGNYAVTLTMRPLQRASVRLSYRYDKRDNQMPMLTWARVVTDAFPTTDFEENIPYSFERGRLNLGASYRLFDTLTLSGGYDRTDLDREFQEVASQSEDSGWGKLRWRPTSGLEATFKGGASRREPDAYDTDIGLEHGQNPLMRKYYLAYRYREFGEVGLSASLANTPISIGMTWLSADDSFSRSELGMTEASEDRFTVDFNWAFRDNASLYLTAGMDAIEALQFGSESFVGPVWRASHDDDFRHYGGGLHFAGLGEKVDLAFNYTRSDGKTRIRYIGQSVAGDPLPDLESTMDSLRFTARYDVSARMAIDVGARWERFKSEDWGLEGVTPDTIANVLTVGASPYDYDVWVFSVGFTYRAGADDEK